MEGAERMLIEGYQKNTLWDLSGKDIAWVMVETPIIIEGLAMARHLSLESMEKEITRLKQLVSQLQGKLEIMPNKVHRIRKEFLVSSRFI